jgi:uncharacterized membrane protein
VNGCLLGCSNEAPDKALGNKVTYEELTYMHLATVVPAFLLGTVLMFQRKGTQVHRQIGRTYLGLLLVTSIVTVFMEAKVGPRLFDHFGFIHLLTALTLYAVPAAYIAARQHNVRRHRILMISTYIGAILVAGILAFTPGRFLHKVFVAQPGAPADGLAFGSASLASLGAAQRGR